MRPKATCCDCSTIIIFNIIAKPLNHFLTLLYVRTRPPCRTTRQAERAVQKGDELGCLTPGALHAITGCAYKCTRESFSLTLKNDSPFWRNESAQKDVDVYVSLSLDNAEPVIRRREAGPGGTRLIFLI